MLLFVQSILNFLLKLLHFFFVVLLEVQNHVAIVQHLFHLSSVLGRHCLHDVFLLLDLLLVAFHLPVVVLTPIESQSNGFVMYLQSSDFHVFVTDQLIELINVPFNISR